MGIRILPNASNLLPKSDLVIICCIQTSSDELRAETKHGHEPELDQLKEASARNLSVADRLLVREVKVKERNGDASRVRGNRYTEQNNMTVRGSNTRGVVGGLTTGRVEMEAYRKTPSKRRGDEHVQLEEKIRPRGMTVGCYLGQSHRSSM